MKRGSFVKDRPTSEPIRVIQYGLGSIGCAIARHVLERHGVELVGAVDMDPRKVGRDAGEVIGAARPLGFPVCARLTEVLTRAPAHVAVHSTSSYLNLVKGQIIELLEAGLDVISTAEELSFPWLAHPEDAQELDVAAKRCGKSVLGTGVNPGFLMDTLPTILTAICQSVERMEVTRVVNASTRRAPFQAKIGCGMTLEEFEAGTVAGQIGHVGLRESMDAVAHALGRRLTRYEITVEPLIAERPIVTEHFAVKPGQICGLKQTGRGFTGEGEFIKLTFFAALNAEDEHDVIEIQGCPNLKMTLRGTNGDLATVAIVVNAIPRVIAAAPGLVTMQDLPPVHLW
ncbi:MAG: dihydrodipicolinate reductase [Anaerolineae bacterium]|nr:dihydrodipicolinate reductase [Anaerolineae bacterium]MDW8098782.1 dihydrodipicolinate reductase [Anaerolineae bacterium]